MRYSGLLILWALVWFLPQQAGAFYDDHFNLYQSICSLLIMVYTLLFIREWWRAELCTLCVLQILHNLGDFWFDFPVQNYSQIQSVFNTLEISLIVIAGGLTQLYQVTYGRDSAAGGADRGRDDAAPRTSSGRRHA